MNRAKGLLTAGDIPPARLLLERAADAQQADAALLLAQTYDPDVLGTQDIRNITARSGDGARLVPEGRPARLGRRATPPQPASELTTQNKFQNESRGTP